MGQTGAGMDRGRKGGRSNRQPRDAKREDLDMMVHARERANGSSMRTLFIDNVCPGFIFRSSRNSRTAWTAKVNVTHVKVTWGTMPATFCRRVKKGDVLCTLL